MMQISKEPLVQFLVLGGLLFAAYTAFAPATEPPRAQIVIDAPRLRSLEQSFEAAWKRAPTESERRGLIDDFLAEEVFYREAQKLGLDQNDVVIRRRMRQKMEFLLQDEIERAAPKDDVLQAFFEENPTRYRGPDRITFRQIYLGDATTMDGQSSLLLAKLNATNPPDPQTLGQRTMLPATLTSATPGEIDGLFGIGFGEQLLDLPTGGWAGPVRSGFGLHLIYLDDVIAAPAVSFDNVRDAVLRDFQYEKQREATSALIERLKQNYDIIYGEGVN